MNKKGSSGTAAIITVSIVISLIICLMGFDYVAAGNIGVRDTLGKVDAVPVQPGIAWTGLTTSTKTFSTRIQLAEYQSSAASKDLQIVTTEVALNFRMNPMSAPEIYKTIGKNYQDIIIAPVVQEAVKSSTAKYTAENLVKERPAIKADITNSIIAKLENKGLIVTEVSITDFDFSDEFNSAIERKQVAEQNALTAKNELDAMTYTSQSMELQKDVLEIKKLDLQFKALENDALWIAQWNGEMPKFLMSSGSEAPEMILNIPSLTE